MKKKPLHVSLHAREPSVVELTVGDRVQLDRLTPSSRGYRAERHGCLLDPGPTTLALAPGHYFFKTLSAANLRVVTGGVSAGIVSHDKDPWPSRPRRPTWPETSETSPPAKRPASPSNDE